MLVPTPSRMTILCGSVLEFTAVGVIVSNEKLCLCRSKCCFIGMITVEGQIEFSRKIGFFGVFFFHVVNLRSWWRTFRGSICQNDESAMGIWFFDFDGKPQARDYFGFIILEFMRIFFYLLMDAVSEYYVFLCNRKLRRATGYTLFLSTRQEENPGEKFKTCSAITSWWSKFLIRIISVQCFIKAFQILM